MSDSFSTRTLSRLAFCLWCSISPWCLSSAQGAWGRILDDRLTMIEHVETIFTAWRLDQCIYSTHNGATLTWFELSAPNEKTYDVTGLAARARKNFEFAGSPWKPVPAADIPYVAGLRQAEVLLSYVWPMSMSTADGVVQERSVYVLMKFDAVEKRAHLQIVQMHR